MECTNESTIISASPIEGAVLQCDNSTTGCTDECSQHDEVSCSGIHATTNDSIDSKRRKMDDNIDVFCKETTRLKDIIGHARAKLRIEEIILPMGLPDEVASSVLRGIRQMPASILLYGPPGCGKVSLPIKWIKFTLICFPTKSICSFHSFCTNYPSNQDTVGKSNSRRG
jgi:ATP-dependent 26S proteasome regulatory subunit